MVRLMSDEIELGQDVLEVKFTGLNIVQEVSLLKRSHDILLCSVCSQTSF